MLKAVVLLDIFVETMILFSQNSLLNIKIIRKTFIWKSLLSQTNYWCKNELMNLWMNVHWLWFFSGNDCISLLSVGVDSWVAVVVSGLSRDLLRLWWYLSLAVSYMPSDLIYFERQQKYYLCYEGISLQLLVKSSQPVTTRHWEVALTFSDHCILGNFTPPPQLNGCVSHCEPCWGKHRQYVMSKKLTTVSHHTDSEDSCDILSCTEGKY